MESKKILRTNILISKISRYFDKESYYGKYSLDIWITLLSIFVALVIIVYTYMNSRIRLEKLNWEKNKCNPFYMPFASRITGNGGDFVTDNLKNCLNDYSNEVASIAFSPVDVIMSMFLETFKFISIMFSQLFNYIMLLVNILINVFKELMLRLLAVVEAFGELFNKILYLLRQFLGFLTGIYYFLLVAIDSIRMIPRIWAISFLVMAIIPSTVASAIAIISLAVFTLIALVWSPIFCIGCWAWVPVVSYTILVILSVAWTVFLWIVYMIFNKEATDLIAMTEDIPE